MRPYKEEELTDLEWARRAPELEPGSFLRKEDGSDAMDPRGVALAFVKEGYFAQCDAIGLPREEPHWTSLALRRSQTLQFTNLKRFSRIGAPTASKLGLVEICTVVSATYHRRILPEDSPALTTAIDFYVDSGTGEWLIPRARYEEAQKRAWRRGNRFKMFWDAPETPGVGIWWHGVVRGRVQRDRFDPLRDSPWEALRVRWDSGGQETMVSMWEIQPEDPPAWLPPPPREEVAVSDDEAVWQLDWHSSSDSEDSDETEGQRRKRRRQRRHVVLPGEIETEQHLRDPARRQRRANSSQPQPQGQAQAQAQANRSSGGSADEQAAEAPLRPPPPPPLMPRDAEARPPLTMQRPSSRHLKMDWNSLFCGRCGDGGELLECDGTCLRSFHQHCLTSSERPSPDDPPDAKWFCPDCRLGIGSCAICKRTGVVGQHILKCKMGSCGYYYHNACLNTIKDSGCLKIHREDPAVAAGGNGERVFTCPAHFCHACRVSGDAQRMLRCWRCPTAYHSRCKPEGVRRMNAKNIECVSCSRLCAASVGVAAVHMVSPVPTPRNRHETGPSTRAVFDCGSGEDPIQRKRPRKPSKDGGSANRNGAAMRPASAGPSNPNGQPQAQPPVAAQPSVATGPSADAAQRPTRLAVLEARIMEDAAVEEALNCTGRIVPLEGNSGSKDLVGKTVFTFGAQKKAGDFYVPSDRIKVHSQLVVHPGGRITIGFCNAQARERYPITIIHAEGDPTTLTNMQCVPLRHQDVLTIAGACFIFERVGIEEALAAR
ncbi:hypothetical protein WJX75_007876 [Coccomyxa subellipsoidea]|uniref:PHD-type domain-containing protein n=1 Tax=Coccomyxa subellipsoidea TaxID=248742 RepID=A0ABR2YZJ3_9CHLO